MLFAMFIYQHKWVYIFTSRLLRPNGSPNGAKWSFSRDLRGAMYRIHVQSRSHATLYKQSCERANPLLGWVGLRCFVGTLHNILSSLTFHWFHPWLPDSPLGHIPFAMSSQSQTVAPSTARKPFISTGREPQLILVPYPVPPSQY